MKRLAIVALLIAGCNRTDLSADQPDLSMPPDMTMRDMAMQMTSCGETILCVIQSGGDPSGLPMCLQGATPETYVQVALLGFCAYQNCISGSDAGQPDMFALIRCLGESCRNELAMCDGLPFGGGGM